VDPCAPPARRASRHRATTAGEIASRLWELIGSRCSEPYVASIEPALTELHRKAGARLTIIGDATARFDGPLDAMVDRVQWREDDAEQQLAAFDVGLGPLTDDRFSRGKSAYKLLQYGAAGLPFVASDVGTNASVTQPLGGRLAAHPADWVDHVIDLLEAPEERRRAAGAAARSAVVASFSYQAWANRWLTALELPVPLIADHVSRTVGQAVDAGGSR